MICIEIGNKDGNGIIYFLNGVRVESDSKEFKLIKQLYREYGTFLAQCQNRFDTKNHDVVIKENRITITDDYDITILKDAEVSELVKELVAVVDTKES